MSEKSIGKGKPDVKKQLQLSRKISAGMKILIAPYLTSSSTYSNGKVWGLRQPDGLYRISSKVSGCRFGAYNEGFFVYTHRARSKGHKDPMKITKKEIDFVESTG